MADDKTKTPTLSLDILREAVKGAVAIRSVTRLEPAGGPGDKVFPPTYERGTYATETRRIAGADVACVLLDSVQSQANRMELALLRAWDAGRIPLPVVAVDFREANLAGVSRVTSLDAPHRLVDAILRDSYLSPPGGQKPTSFPKSLEDRGFDAVSVANAALLYELCPTGLVFGLWDSTGKRGGSGVKFARAMVSEIVGVNAVVGKKTSSRIDPLQIQLKAGPLYEGKDGTWTLDDKEAKTEKAAKGENRPKLLGKAGKPSEANHGNVTPTIGDGGVTIDYALQTTVLSLAGLRRLGFPGIDGKGREKNDLPAQTALAALALAATTLADADGLDLRSRCLLCPTKARAWEIIGGDGRPSTTVTLSDDASVRLLSEAVEAAKRADLPAWPKKGRDELGSLVLKPLDKLVTLVRKSQELVASGSTEE